MTSVIGEEKYTISIIPQKTSINNSKVLNKSSFNIDKHVIVIEDGCGAFDVIHNIIYQLCVIQKIKNQ